MSHAASRPNRRKVFRSVAALSAVALSLALVATVPACKSPFKKMTDARAEIARQEKVEEAEAAETQREAKEGISEMKEAEKALQRKALQLQKRQEREDRRRQAAALLGSDPEQALAIAQAILDEPVDDGSERPAEKSTPGSEETSDGEDDAAAKDGEGSGEDGADGDGTGGEDGDGAGESDEEEERVLPPPMTDAEKARVLVVKGSALFELDRTDEAIPVYEEAFRLDSSLRVARRNLGKLLFMKRKYEEAIRVWQREFADGYRDADILYLYGQALYELGRQKNSPSLKEAARQAIQSVLVERPDDDEVRRWRAILEFETGRFEEAIRLFEAILEEKPLDPEYLGLLANCYSQLERYRDAVGVMELAARVRDPSPEEARFIGDLYAMLDDPDRAAEWLVRSYGGEVDSAPAEDRFRIGFLFADAEKVEEAARWLDSIDESAREYGDAQARLAYIYRSQGDAEQALGAYQKIRSSRPRDGRAHLAAGDLYLEAKRLEEARKAYADAAGLPETKGDGLAGMAEVYYAEQNLEQAVSYYAQAIKASPEDVRFRAAHREIQEELRFRREVEETTSSLSPNDESEGTPEAVSAVTASPIDEAGS